MLNLLRDLHLPERLRYDDGVEFVEIDLLPRQEPNVLRGLTYKEKTDEHLPDQDTSSH